MLGVVGELWPRAQPNFIATRAQLCHQGLRLLTTLMTHIFNTLQHFMVITINLFRSACQWLPLTLKILIIDRMIYWWFSLQNQTLKLSNPQTLKASSPCSWGHQYPSHLRGSPTARDVDCLDRTIQALVVFSFYKTPFMIASCNLSTANVRLNSSTSHMVLTNRCKAFSSRLYPEHRKNVRRLSDDIEHELHFRYLCRGVLLKCMRNPLHVGFIIKGIARMLIGLLLSYLSKNQNLISK